MTHETFTYFADLCMDVLGWNEIDIDEVEGIVHQLAYEGFLKEEEMFEDEI